MIDFFKKYYIPISITFFILIGFIFRIYLLLNRGAFWFDEMFTFHFSQFSLGQIWSYMIYENNPPLFVFLLHFLGKIIPLTEITARSFSLIINVASIIGIYFLGKKMFSKKTGLIAAFLVSISSLQILNAVEARTYSLMFYLAIISTYFFWDFFNIEKEWKKFSYYTSASTLLIYTHLFSWFLIITQWIVVLINFKRIQFKKFILSQIIIIGAYLIWFLPTLINKLNMPIAGGWFFNIEVLASRGLRAVREFLFFGDFPFLDIALIIVLIFLIYIAVFKNKKEKNSYFLNSKFLYLIILVLFPLFVGFLHTKYYIVCSIGLYLLIAKAIDNLKLDIKSNVIILCLIFFGLLYQNINMLEQVKHEWDRVADYIKQNEQSAEKVIISRFNNKILIDRYYQGNLQTIGFLPVEEKNQDENFNIVIYNWIIYLNKDNVAQINELIKENNEFIFVSAEIGKEELIKEWLLEKGWAIKDYKQFGGIEEPEVYIFKRK